jgi:hypothetical protein
VYIQANGYADLDYADTCETGEGGNSNIFFFYLCINIS